MSKNNFNNITEKLYDNKEKIFLVGSIIYFFVEIRKLKNNLTKLSKIVENIEMDLTSLETIYKRSFPMVKIPRVRK